MQITNLDASTSNISLFNNPVDITRYELDKAYKADDEAEPFLPEVEYFGWMWIRLKPRKYKINSANGNQF